MNKDELVMTCALGLVRSIKDEWKMRRCTVWTETESRASDAEWIMDTDMSTALITRCRALRWLFPDKDLKIYYLCTNSAHNCIIRQEQRYVAVPHTNHRYCMIILTFGMTNHSPVHSVIYLQKCFKFAHNQCIVNRQWAIFKRGLD